MVKFKITMASVAVVVLIGCGDNSSSDNNDNTSRTESISVGDVLGISNSPESNNTERDNRDGTAVPETDVGKTTITSDPVDAIDIFETKNVGYTLKSSSLPVCYNTGDIRLDYNTEIPTYTCRWLCGIHQGDGPIEVELIFTKPGLWVLSEEVLSTACSRCK